jgi:hypothetical protein
MSLGVSPEGKATAEQVSSKKERAANVLVASTAS